METKREKTREMIIDKSRSIFAEFGYKIVTMKEICEATGLSRGGLYSHFSSVNEIFQAVLDKLCKSEIFDFENEIKQGKKATEILETALSSLQNEMITSKDSLSLALYEYADKEGKEYLEKWNLSFENRWKILLSYGIEQGEFNKVDIDEIVNTLLYAYQGIRLWSRIVTIDNDISQSIINHIRKQLIGE